MSINSILNTTNDLHSFSVINFFASAWIIVKYSKSSIKRSWNKLSSRWRIVNITNSTNMIFMDSFCLIHLSHIKGVAVGIITSNCKINWLNWIEWNTHRFIWKCNFLNWSLASKIIKDNGSINTGGT